MPIIWGKKREELHKKGGKKKAEIMTDKGTEIKSKMMWGCGGSRNIGGEPTLTREERGKRGYHYTLKNEEPEKQKPWKLFQTKEEMGRNEDWRG